MCTNVSNRKPPNILHETEIKDNFRVAIYTSHVLLLTITPEERLN